MASNSARKALAEATFRARIEELGGTVVGEYVNNSTPTECLCSKGHTCRPQPTHIQQGGGMCLTCAGKDPITAETNFRRRIEELGGTVIGEYTNNYKAVECVCKEGHLCFPIPTSIRSGNGMCVTCAGRDPVLAEANFRAQVKTLGGTVVGEYMGKDVPVQCVCLNGHICHPRPGNLRQIHQGMCLECVGHSPVSAEANFRARVEALGGTVIGEYRGNSKSVECICINGHVCHPLPAGLQQGEGMCGKCTRKHDRFYLYLYPNDYGKFGVASGEARGKTHFSRGAVLVAEWSNKEYVEVTKLENEIKKLTAQDKVRCTREEMPDGYTESFKWTQENIDKYVPMMIKNLGDPTYLDSYNIRL